jgi:hypothetical protein
MSRKKKHHGRFVSLQHYMLQSPAWQGMGAIERAMYVDIASMYAGPGSTNGRITYSIRMAAESLHIGKSTAARALLTLQERGFIVAVTKGAFNLKAIKHASTWRLTEFNCDVTGEIATKAFMNWGKRAEAKAEPTSPALHPH